MFTIAQHYLSLTAVFTLICCLVACRNESNVAKATRNGILLAGNGAEPKALDPHLVNGVNEGNIIRSILEGLVIDHPSKDGIAMPGAAERWEPNEDFSVWTFHLRKNAKWSDGQPLTAHDFTFAYERILSPKLGAGTASILFSMKNAKEFNKGQLTDFSQVGVKALDDHTLKITLRTSTPYFLELVKFVTWAPIPKHIVLKYGKIDDRFTDWAKPPNMVTNGPFVPTEWKITTSVSVRKNQYYWDKDKVRLNGIDFIPIPNEFTETRMFLDEQLHLTYTLPPEMISFAKEKIPEKHRSEPYIGSSFLRCNVTKPPLDNPKVRAALAAALDRKVLCEQVLQGAYLPATGFVPPFGDYKEAKVIGFNPEKAKQLLKESGFSSISAFPDITYLTTDRQSSRRLAEAIQDMWRKHLGINVRIEQMEWSSYRERQNNLDYDISWSGWIGDYLDPTTFLDLWVEGEGNNKTGWGSKEYESLLRQAEQARNPLERINILSNAEKSMLKEMPIIPLYYYATNYLLQPQVKGWDPLLLNNHPFKFVSLEATE